MDAATSKATNSGLLRPSAPLAYERAPVASAARSASFYAPSVYRDWLNGVQVGFPEIEQPAAYFPDHFEDGRLLFHRKTATAVDAVQLTSGA